MAVTAALSIQDIYGSRSGAAPRITAKATPGATRMVSGPGSASDPSGGRLGAVISRSSPIYGAIVIIVFAILLRLVAEQIGSPEEFKNIKLNPWNAVVITILAMLGFFLLKIAMVLFPVPHLANVVMGA